MTVNIVMHLHSDVFVGKLGCLTLKFVELCKHFFNISLVLLHLIVNVGYALSPLFSHLRLLDLQLGKECLDLLDATV